MNPQHPSDCTTGDNEPHKVPQVSDGRPPYLTEEDAQIVLSYDVCMLRSASRAALLDESAISAEGSKTLTTFLEDGVADLVAARKAKGNNDDQRAERDFVLCTSHDLAPLLQEACGFTKGYFETRAFRDGYRRWGKEVRKANKKTKGLDRND
ncbi:hypothetical protein BN946_scf185044.g24 [Trametes cinnabarina]|uniref:Uncharacterized protein n=1 Tax=Pycnoporus cinnabarinus TaxID=5643 RepID=A0A060S1Q6_PYCCI|nr:hypothetical protein BN946_scf185044.g24 [Trametes cinnabarina]